MIVVTTETIPGRTICDSVGVVRGNSIRAKHIGKDILASFRSVVGGELSEYTEMMAETRNQAMQRMVKDAESLGADAVVGVRFVTAQVMAGAAELLVFGTAVTLEPKS